MAGYDNRRWANDEVEPMTNKQPGDPGGRYTPEPLMPSYGGRFREDEDGSIACIKYLLFGYNMLIFVCGGVLLGVGIWLAVDRGFMTYIIGTNLYAAAIYLLLIGGAFILIMSFLGCCGALTENKCMLYTFFIILCVLFLMIFIGGILAIIFHTQIGSAIKGTMQDTLINYYGVNFQSDYNRQVTDAWDQAQEKLMCCSVSTESWAIYRQSKWFNQFGARDIVNGVIVGDEGQKPFVPQSCCVKDFFWRYVDLTVCQTWRLGPPGSPVDGAINRAIYYQGCYDAAINYLLGNTAILIGLGIGIGVLLVGGIVLSFFLIRHLRAEEKE